MTVNVLQTPDLAQRLAEAEATIEALLSGQIDAVVDSKSHTPVLLAQAQEDLRRSQKRLRDIIDGLGPSMFVGLLTPGGILLEANRPVLEAAGLEPEDVVGKPFEDTYWWSFSPESRARMRATIERAARGEASRYDVQVRAARGELIDVDFSLQPLRDETGAVVFLVPSGTIITARKRTENALRESNENFHHLADNITDVFWIRSPDMRDVQYISPAYERIWGRRVDTLYSQPLQWTDHILPEDRTRVDAAFATLRGDVPSIDLEYRIVRPDGAIRWVRTHSAQLCNPVSATAISASLRRPARLLHHPGVDGHDGFRQRGQQFAEFHQVIQVGGGIPVVEAVTGLPRRVERFVQSAMYADCR